MDRTELLQRRADAEEEVVVIDFMLQTDYAPSRDNLRDLLESALGEPAEPGVCSPPMFEPSLEKMRDRGLLNGRTLAVAWDRVCRKRTRPYADSGI